MQRASDVPNYPSSACVCACGTGEVPRWQYTHLHCGELGHEVEVRDRAARIEPQRDLGSAPVDQYGHLCKFCYINVHGWLAGPAPLGPAPEHG